MKVVALIPVKLGSKRVPGKNIKPFFDGTPLIHFIQKACLNAKNIDEVYVYCSSEEVQSYILPGVKYLKRPEYLDGDNINANDFILEFINTIDADIYVNAHTTSPFAKTQTIEELVEKVSSGEYDSAFCAENIKTFMWMNGKPMNFDPDHFPRTQDLEPIYMETSGAFVFSKEVFVTYNRRVGVKPCLVEVEPIESIDIDTVYDMLVAQSLYKNMQENK